MESTVISIVDDDPAVRESLGALLESHGFSVELYESGEAFLSSDSLARGHTLFLDVNLSGMSGFDVLNQLARKAPKRPVVMMTGRIDRRMHQQAIEAGANALLQKPLEAEAVFSMIRRYPAANPAG